MNETETETEPDHVRGAEWISTASKRKVGPAGTQADSSAERHTGQVSRLAGWSCAILPGWAAPLSCIASVRTWSLQTAAPHSRQTATASEARPDWAHS